MHVPKPLAHRPDRVAHKQAQRHYVVVLIQREAVPHALRHRNHVTLLCMNAAEQVRGAGVATGYEAAENTAVPEEAAAAAAARGAPLVTTCSITKQ